MTDTLKTPAEIAAFNAGIRAAAQWHIKTADTYGAAKAKYAAFRAWRKKSCDADSEQLHRRFASAIADLVLLESGSGSDETLGLRVPNPGSAQTDSI